MAGNPCSDSAISYAWIDPHGKIHQIRSGTHLDWAVDFVEGSPALQDKLWDEAGGDAMDLLMIEGWVRMSNAWSLQVWDTDEPSLDAWETVVGIMTDCALKDRRFDPERQMVMLETATDFDSLPMAEFIRRYIGRQAEDEFFERLMTRAARRVATKYLRNR